MLTQQNAYGKFDAEISIKTKIKRKANENTTKIII